MFQHIQQYRTEIINFLTEINGNIDWNDFINKNMSYPDDKILNKIKSLIWVDKDIDYDTGMYYNINLYTYYTNLINKYYPILSQPGIEVQILDFATDDKANVDEYIINELRKRLSVLTHIFTYMRIPFKLTTSINPNAKLVFPTCSITYTEPNKLFNSFSGIMAVDDFYNIYVNEYEKELNFFKLSILQLSKNSEISIPDILQQKYGFLKLKK